MPAPGARRVLAAVAAFVAGFFAVFVALGATASVVDQAVSAHLGVLSYVAGILIIAMGLHFLGVVRLGLLDRTARVGVSQKPAGLAGAFVVGLASASAGARAWGRRSPAC
ncbi:MAG TPA: cytochrome c biogenesis protein CcdA [Pseudolabrys sp.]|nr:cytochrome c biogenesis protein CcdA [Pseudolabrys sp.]